ncbi:MAG: IS6 family transposase [Sphingomonadales bacterium]|nr:IS6 family transposase [Sphingomonadales bacterium]
MMSKTNNPFRYFHSSPEVIRLVVLMYVRFPLSLRNVEDLLFERGIDLCHETVRLWWNRFGPMFAADIRRPRVNAMRGIRHWRWHLDEAYVKIIGELHYLWRAVDHEGEILEPCDEEARQISGFGIHAKRTLKRHGKAEAIVTDGLKSYPPPCASLAISIVVKRADGSTIGKIHTCLSAAEGVSCSGFRRMKTLQKFSSVHAEVHNHFSQERHSVSRQEYKETPQPPWLSGRILWPDERSS